MGDVRMLDGQAAITFRSCYAGDTVIRATSPGLTPAEITLHFTGPVAYEEGKTSAVQPRPHVKFNRAAQPRSRNSSAATAPPSPLLPCRIMPAPPPTTGVTFPTSSAPF
jgi:hypothetical protein